jgi:hypothetical protein
VELSVEELGRFEVASCLQFHGQWSAFVEYGWPFFDLVASATLAAVGPLFL